MSSNNSMSPSQIIFDFYVKQLENCKMDTEMHIALSSEMINGSLKIFWFENSTYKTFSKDLFKMLPPPEVFLRQISENQATGTSPFIWGHSHEIKNEAFSGYKLVGNDFYKWSDYYYPYKSYVVYLEKK